MSNSSNKRVAIAASPSIKVIRSFPERLSGLPSRAQSEWVWINHAQRVQLQHPEVMVVFDIDPTAAAATWNQLLPELAREDVLIAGQHMNFPALGRLRKEGSGYSWASVVFTDRWDEKQ
jgi:hypothetical protein